MSTSAGRRFSSPDVMWPAGRRWLGLILMGWFDRYCITLKALPIFPVTFSTRPTDSPPPSRAVISPLTHISTQHLGCLCSSFKDKISPVHEISFFYCIFVSEENSYTDSYKSERQAYPYPYPMPPLHFL